MVSIGDESYVAWREDSEEQEAIQPMELAVVAFQRRMNINGAFCNLSVTLVLILFIADDSLIFNPVIQSHGVSTWKYAQQAVKPFVSVHAFRMMLPLVTCSITFPPRHSSP